MDPVTISLIMGGAGLLGKLFQKKPKYGMDTAQIDSMIQAVRSQGLAGLSSMAQREQEGAAARLGASGMAMTPAMQQAAFAPIFNSLTGARTDLEGQLGGLEGRMKSHAADMQMGADMAQYQDWNDILGGMMGMGATGALGIGQGFGGGAFGAGGGGMNPLQLPAGSKSPISDPWSFNLNTLLTG